MLSGAPQSPGKPSGCTRSHGATRRAHLGKQAFHVIVLVAFVSPAWYRPTKVCWVDKKQTQGGTKKAKNDSEEERRQMEANGPPWEAGPCFKDTDTLAQRGTGP